MLLVIFVTVQSVGSHACFVFQDGIYGEPRDMRVTAPEKAAGGIWRLWRVVAPVSRYRRGDDNHRQFPARRNLRFQYRQIPGMVCAEA